MTVSKSDITSVLPQRFPFIMIDNLVSADPKGFESDFIAAAENIFTDNGILGEAALIENIAQTCAAGFGSMHKNGNLPPRLGFIGAVSKLKVYELPLCGKTIQTKIEVMMEFENVFLVKGQNFCDGNKLVECEMKIVLS